MWFDDDIDRNLDVGGLGVQNSGVRVGWRRGGRRAGRGYKKAAYLEYSAVESGIWDLGSGIWNRTAAIEGKSSSSRQ